MTRLVILADVEEPPSIGDKVKVTALAVAAGGGAMLLLAQSVAAFRPSVTAKTRQLAEAIALAEGFYVSGSLAQRANNPGNLKLPGHAGHGEIDGKTIFGSLDDGWAKLYQQIELIASGRSAYYRPDMTFQRIAEIYTGGDKSEAWVRIVTSQIGATPNTIFAQWWVS